MYKIENHKELKFVGVCKRLNNNQPDLIESFVKIWDTAKIEDQNLLNSTIYAVYTNYESDYLGDYDYIIGHINFLKVKESVNVTIKEEYMRFFLFHLNHTMLQVFGKPFGILH